MEAPKAAAALVGVLSCWSIGPEVEGDVDVKWIAHVLTLASGSDKPIKRDPSGRRGHAIVPDFLELQSARWEEAPARTIGADTRRQARAFLHGIETDHYSPTVKPGRNRPPASHRAVTPTRKGETWMVSEPGKRQ